MVGNAHHQHHVVLDQNHRDAELGDAAKKLAERVLVRAHQASGGLIEQQHARPHGQRAGDLDEAAIDMRQVCGRRRQRTVVTDKGKQPFGRPAVIGG